MTKLRLFALFFIATNAGSIWAAGVSVYKCGSTYSQTPCEGAVSVRVDDARSKEQKSLSDAAIVQQGNKANAMEKSRLKEEAQAIAQNKPMKSGEKSTVKTQTKAKVDTGTAGAPKDSKAKKKEPEFFTAKETVPAKKP